MIEYGLQMYSVRDVTKENLKDALRQVAEMGYKHVEFAGFFGNTAEDVKAWLDEFGLAVSATHTGCAEITPDNIKKTIAYHQALGCTDLIVPGARYNTPEELEYTIALLNSADKKLAARREEGGWLVKGGVLSAYSLQSGLSTPANRRLPAATMGAPFTLPSTRASGAVTFSRVILRAGMANCMGSIFSPVRK